jgi:cyclopropane fatty-acyl-phospholipid synthase-like methyltransferase
MYVLDLGCGLGGASRYLAAERGCRVAGVDLTPNFVEAARILTNRD